MNNNLKGKLTGWTKSKIIAISPNEEELLELTGEAELEKELNYTFQNKAGNDCCVLDFYISDINDENIFKYSIYLENKEKVSKNGSNLYVNNLGASQWANDSSTLFLDFTQHLNKKWNNTTNKYDILGKLADKQYHIALVGEYELLSLLKATGVFDLKDIDSSLFVDMDKLFSGNFEDIKNIIPIGVPLFSSFIYIDLDTKEQKVFKNFLPLNLYQEACSQTSTKYTKGQHIQWRKEWDFISESCIYNLGKLREVKEEDLPKINQFLDEDSEY